MADKKTSKKAAKKTTKKAVKKDDDKIKSTTFEKGQKLDFGTPFIDKVPAKFNKEKHEPLELQELFLED